MKHNDDELHSPLFMGLWGIAHKNIISYQSDLVHDAIILSRAKPGDKFLWGWRETGTTMCGLQGLTPYSSCIRGSMKASTCPLDNWYLVIVEENTNAGYPSGYVKKVEIKNLDDITEFLKIHLTPTP